MKFIFVLSVCFAVCMNLSAQTASVAQINGTVKDQSGALLPGVDIKVTHAETGYSRSAVTDETGAYILPNLPIGPYRLEASLPGFSTYVQTGIVLQVNSNPTIPIVLAVGAVSETDYDQAQSAQVGTHNNARRQRNEQKATVVIP